MASGGPPECATIVVMPDAPPASKALPLERGRAVTDAPPRHHSQANSNVVTAISTSTKWRSTCRSTT